MILALSATLALHVPIYFPSDLYLVRAKATAVTKYDAWQKGDGLFKIGTFKITSVFAGPAELKGRTFQCEIAPWQPISGFSQSNDRKVQTTEIGAEGLWWVTCDPKNQGFRKDLSHAVGYTKWRASRDPKGDAIRPELREAVIDAYAIRWFPYQTAKGSDRGGFNPKYDRTAEWKEGLAWAKAVASVYNAATLDGRRTRLEQLATVPDSPIAGWAASVLVRANPTAYIPFLQRLTKDEKLSIGSQVTLDRQLAELDPNKWPNSEARRQLFGRWLKPGVANSAMFEAGIVRLLDATYYGEISFPTYAAVLDPVLAESNRLKDRQEHWLGRALREPKIARADRPEAFKWLTAWVRDAKTPFLRAHAAAGLRQVCPLSKDQQAAVRKLQREATDSTVRKELDRVLQNATNNPTGPVSRRE